MRKLILASTSPWRKKILATTGLPFSVEKSGYKENMKLPFAPRALARYLALGKARAVAKKHKDAIIIGADTFVVFQGKLLGKPLSSARAKTMLTQLSGKTHTILTGFAVVDSKTGRSLAETAATSVKMRKLSPVKISAYIKTGEPLKAAGAYAIQGWGRVLVERFSGDLNNVVGLPLAALMKTLAKFDIRV